MKYSPSHHPSGSPVDNAPGDARRGCRFLGGDEGGAVLVVCLAGILIILLLAMMTYDAGMATRDKTRVQGAADFAALSQASVKARSMNMIAYSNISKRSIWAIHSLYPAHIRAYRDWLIPRLNALDECVHDGDKWDTAEDRVDDDALGAAREDFDRCLDLLANVNIYEDATGGNFLNFSGEDHSDTAPSQLGEPILPVEESLSLEYYARDLHAIDNYQRFIIGSTPWWAWVEKLLTGIRNGATLTASYPGPPISGVATTPGFDDFSDLIPLTNNTDLATINVANLDEDQLPVTPATDPVDQMENHIHSAISAELGGIDQWENIRNKQGNVDDPFVLEHLANNSRMVSQSSGLYRDVGDLNAAVPPTCAGDDPDANCAWYPSDKKNLVWAEAPVEKFLDYGLAYSAEAFELYSPSQAAQPWIMDNYSPSGWLLASSNLVISYLADHEFLRGDVGREKFDFAGTDPMIDGNFFEDSASMDVQVRQSNMYGAVGYWGMARGEMAFGDGDQPDMWHPSWAAKLRPVSLPGELRGRVDMGRMYHHILPHIRLAQQLGLTDLDDIETGDHARDFARMDWIMRSYSDSTIEGVAK